MGKGRVGCSAVASMLVLHVQMFVWPVLHLVSVERLEIYINLIFLGIIILNCFFFFLIYLLKQFEY